MAGKDLVFFFLNCLSRLVFDINTDNLQRKQSSNPVLNKVIKPFKLLTWIGSLEMTRTFYQSNAKKQHYDISFLL